LVIPERPLRDRTGHVDRVLDHVGSGDRILGAALAVPIHLATSSPRRASQRRPRKVLSSVL
jgi:hypothetical protein